MGLWNAFGELWGWLSDEKPDGADVFPTERAMELNGGCDKEGAFEASIEGFDLLDPKVQELFSSIFNKALEEEDREDWEDEEDDDDGD